MEPTLVEQVVVFKGLGQAEVHSRIVNAGGRSEEQEISFVIRMHLRRNDGRDGDTDRGPAGGTGRRCPGGTSAENGRCEYTFLEFQRAVFPDLDPLHDFTYRFIRDGQTIKPVRVVVRVGPDDLGGSFVDVRFFHRLRFEPGETALAAVYRFSDLVDPGECFSPRIWEHLVKQYPELHPGGIQRFHVLAEMGDLTGQDPEDPPETRVTAFGLNDVVWTGVQLDPDLEAAGRILTMTLLTARDFRPGAEDSIRVEYSSVEHCLGEGGLSRRELGLCRFAPRFGSPRPALEAGRYGNRLGGGVPVAASSVLPGEYGIYVPEDLSFSGQTHGQDSAADGLVETAWCEGASGPGKGEWIEFRVDQPAIGLTLTNGHAPCRIDYRRCTMTGGDYEAEWFGRFEELKRLFDRYFENNRVKKLKLIRVEPAGMTAVDDVKVWDTPLEQHLTLPYLSPGTYRLLIDDVYSGEGGQHTCLAEVGFLALDANMAALLEGSPFLRASLESAEVLPRAQQAPGP